MMRIILSVLAILLLVGAGPHPVSSGPVRLCAEPPASQCGPVKLEDISIEQAEVTIQRKVEVSEQALPLARPLMVRIVALASSEVRWNGVLLGRNGVPAATAAREKAGRFVATFPVPSHLVRPGSNVVSARISAHHAWLPVKPAVRVFHVGPFQNQQLRDLWAYLPTLLILGVLAAAGMYFLAAAISDRRDRGSLLLALIGGSAVLQLVLQVSPAFIAYSYPQYMVRMVAIPGLASVTAVLAAGYAARRFAQGWQGFVSLGVAAAAVISIVFMPWYGFKALGAILAGAAGLSVCAWYALDREPRAAQTGLATGLIVIALAIWQGTSFLERSYFALLAVLLMIVTIEQIAGLRSISLERDAEAKRAAVLEERLGRAQRENEPIAILRTGSRTHRVAEGDILYVQAADDYCDVVLASGGRLLVTMNLARLLESMSPQFLRVHKSYAVNREHVTGTRPRPGGGRILVLGDKTEVPIGRTYGAAIAACIG